MRSLSRVLSSSIARLKRRRMNQRTPGSSMRSNAAQIASALMISASHNGSVTCDVMAPRPPGAERYQAVVVHDCRPGAGRPDSCRASLAFTASLPRVHVALEQVEALPRRLDRIAAGLRHIDRRLDQLHLRDIARAVRENRARLHAHDHLRADGLRQQRVLARHRRATVDAQPPRALVQIDEQQPDVRIDQQIAEALEHAVAVVIGKRQFGVRRHAHKARRAALERAVRPAFGVGGGDEEIDRAFDERLVVGGERRARQLLLQAIGDAAAVELILQAAIAVVIHDDCGHWRFLPRPSIAQAISSAMRLRPLM